MAKFVTHIALYCKDLERSVEWYQSVLGLKIMAESKGKFTGMTFGEKHHDFALVQAPPDFGDPVVKKAGLYHISIDTGSRDNSFEIYDRFVKQGGTVDKAINHRVGYGIYIRDPDLNLIELWDELYKSYEEANATIPHFDPPFSENPIGWPFDIDTAYEEWKSRRDGK
ncbi:MAG: VOC family protein [Pseudomonadota bacterium]